MTLNIRNQEADDLARELARIDRTSITDAVISALRADDSRKTGAGLPADRKPVPPEAYHDLDHDPLGEK